MLINSRLLSLTARISFDSKIFSKSDKNNLKHCHHATTTFIIDSNLTENINALLRNFSNTVIMSPDIFAHRFCYLTMWYIGRYKICLGIYLSGGNCLPALARPDRFQPSRKSPTPAPSRPSPPTTANCVMYLEPASVSACSVVATTTSANLLAVYHTKIKKNFINFIDITISIP